MNFVTPPGDYALPYTQERSDINLQAIMRLVYVWMGMGLLVTTLVALFTATSPALTELSLNPVVRIGTIIGTFVLVIAISAGVNSQRVSANMALGMFSIYSVAMGFVLGVIFIAFDMSAILPAFGTTVVLFGVMSVFGFTTTLDLTKWGTYLIFGVVGLIVAMIMNALFFGSDTFSLVISVAGVFLFTALTAYDTQKIKNFALSYPAQVDGQLSLKFSIYGALILYLDFVNLFLFLLRIFGGGGRD